MPESFLETRSKRRGSWPQSLAARTSLLLIVGLGVIQAVGLMIHAFDRIDLDHRMQAHDVQLHVLSIYRSIAETLPSERAAEVATLHLPSHFHVTLGPGPNPDSEADVIEHPPFSMPGGPPHHPEDDGLEGGPDDHGGLGDGMDGGPPDHDRMGPPGRPFGLDDRVIPPGAPSALPRNLLPRNIMVSRAIKGGVHSVSLLLPDDTRWLTIDYSFGHASFLTGPAGFLTSPTLPLAFLIMTICGGALILWGVRRLIAPVATLAAAAEALGRDVNTSPLPEDGATEVARAAVAFNTMAARVRRFVTDRTLMLTAIGHDLRTPITRLKLRSEFIDDDELRQKFLNDLDEMEAMVSATLAFGRDSAQNEAMVPLDLTALLQTIMDEATESRPDLTDLVAFTADPPQVMIRARHISLKRALNNIVGNAIKYGGSAFVTLLERTPGRTETVQILIEDDGPGLQEEQLEQMFEPFVRAETSRNRETGGSGLGLAIARTIVRGHGGDIRLQSRAEGGLRAVVTLPV